MSTNKNAESASYLIKAGDLLSVLVLGAFIALLLAGIGLPLYSDEVVTKWMHARLFEPDGITSSLLPQCQAAFSSSLPWAYYPGAVFFSALYGSLSPLGLRLVGVGTALSMMAGFGLWARRSTLSVGGALNLLSLSIALFALGVLPFIWVMARPEQWLVLGLMFFCMVAIAGCKNNGKISWVFLMLYFPVASIFFFVHPKSIFFTPVVLLTTWFITRHSIIRLLLFIAVLWLAYTTYRWGAIVSTCPEAPIVQVGLSSNFLNPSLLLHSPISFLREGIENFLSAPRKIAEQSIFAATFQSGWLPPIAVPAIAVWVASIDRLLVQILIFGALAYSLLLLPVAWLRRKPVTPCEFLGAALALGLCANFFLYRLWPFYGAAQVFPLVLMLLLLMLPGCTPSWLSRPGVQMLRSACLLFALVNMAIFTTYVVPEVWGRADSPEAVVPDQWLSAPVLDFNKRRDAIRMLADQCGIHGDGAAHLVVDHSTYYAFSHLHQPIHVLYISEQAYGADLLGEKLVPFLRKIKSPGVIARCDYIPAALSGLPVFRKEGYCCVPIQKDEK